MARMNLLVLLTLLIFVIWIPASYSRRGGGFRGGGGYRGGGRTYSRTTSYRSGSWTSKSSSFRPKPNIFNKGGVKTFGKIVLASYLAKKMKPSVSFTIYLTVDRDNRPRFCHECISINGSQTSCEEAITYSGAAGTCETSSSKPYCSTEYGLTSDGGKYVKRSCNNNLCSSCDQESGCHTIQCEICNWSDCNKGGYEYIFKDTWSGCLPKNNTKGEFECDSGEHAFGSVVLITIMTILSSFKFY